MLPLETDSNRSMRAKTSTRRRSTAERIRVTGSSLMVRAHTAPWLARHQAPRGGLAALIGLTGRYISAPRSVLPPLPDLPTLRPLPPLPALPPLGARECYQAEVQIEQRSEWLEVCPTDDGRLLLPTR